MFLKTISLAMMILSFLGISFILVRKFPLAANLDPSELEKEKQIKVKKSLLERHFYRRIGEIKLKFLKICEIFKDSFNKSFKKFRGG